MHYSYRTEKTYRYWIRYFILWSGKRHPRDMGAAEVTAFLNYLAGEREVAAATQNQALSALLFLYGRVLEVKLPWLNDLVREGKGNKDRVTMLPEKLLAPLQQHLGRVKRLHRSDLEEGYGEAELPHALERKYPRAAYEWAWQFVFPSKNRSPDPRTGAIRRHHVYPQTVSRAVKRATRASPSTSAATPCVIRSRRTSCSPEATCVRCRSCSGIRTCPRR